MTSGRGSKDTQRARRATGSLYRSYFRTLYLSRLVWVAFWACFVYFAVWSIPWFGVGLSLSDYTPQYTVTLVFVACCLSLGMLSGILRKNARRQRETLVAWSSLYDETTGTHTRSHFYDRLSLECDRSERHGGTFALLLLKIKSTTDRQPGRNGEMLRSVGQRVQEFIRSSDLLALISNDEFGILLCDVNGGTATVLADTMRNTLKRNALEETPDGNAPPDFTAEVGIATYGKEGKTPEALVASARMSVNGKTTVSRRALKKKAA